MSPNSELERQGGESPAYEPDSNGGSQIGGGGFPFSDLIPYTSSYVEDGAEAYVGGHYEPISASSHVEDGAEAYIGGHDEPIFASSQIEDQDVASEHGSSSSSSSSAGVIDDGAGAYIRPTGQLQAVNHQPVSYLQHTGQQGVRLQLPARLRLNREGTNYWEWRTAMENMIRMRDYERFFFLPVTVAVADADAATTTTTSTANAVAAVLARRPAKPRESDPAFSADAYNAWLAWEVGDANAKLFLETSVANDATAARAAMQGKESAVEMWAALEVLHRGA